MGDKEVHRYTDPDRLRVFMKCLLTDLRALEQMLEADQIENGVRRIGAEQELVLVDPEWRPAPVAIEVLEKLSDPMFTTELACFNLEFNMAPLEFKGDCLRAMESEMHARINQVRAAAAECGAALLMTGILPTIRKSDLEIENLTPKPRYHALNEALRNLRGDDFEFRFTGTDELIVRHESVLLEACNTSCQVHFQVSADEFARFYNIAQAIAAPVLAAASNSPLLFGRRLWRETRIALFQQAVDTRQPGHHPQERTRFRVILGMEIDEDPFDMLGRGEAPRLKALQLHNSTVYRWMRPCYGICNGKPHLRIENRVLPAGPTVLDEVANAAFWFGLIGGAATKYGHINECMDFDTAKTNFMVAARHGLDSQLRWLDDRPRPTRELILEEFLPLAKLGLTDSGIDADDIDRYLTVIEKRVSTGRTGAQWLLDSLNALKDCGTKAEQLIAVTSGMWTRQQEGTPVHEWSLARRTESGGWKKSYQRVDQYMTTDVFTVHEDEVIDLVANLMDWERIRHVPVEDSEHRLVGLISYRQLLRFLARDLPHGKSHPVPAKAIMQRDPITVTPETPTLEAIELMRRERVACLPVVKNKRLVGIVTEVDFIAVAAELLEKHLRET